MAEDSLRSAIDAIRSRLHEELETQLAQLTARHAEEVEGARRSAEADAEQRWSARVDDVRNEWTSRLESEVGAVRADAERRMVAESMRLRAEAEQAAAESAAALRGEFEQSLAEERARAEEQLAAERRRADEQLAAERGRAEEHLAAAQQHTVELDAHRTRADELEAERKRIEDAIAAERNRFAQAHDELQRTLDAARHDIDNVKAELGRATQQLEAATHERDGAVRARQDASEREQLLTSELLQARQSREEDTRKREERDAALAEARLAERQSQLAIVERVLTALRSMDTARSLSDVLSSLTSSAAAEAPRVALFVVDGGDLRGWKSAGFSGDASSLRASIKDESVLGDALRRREPVVTGDSDGPAAPGFAGLPAGRAAMAVPLLVGNQPVAVLYADDAADGTPAAPASWPEAIQILGRHASVTLAHLTAARAAETMRRSLAAAGARRPGGAPAANGAEDDNNARRYARLLVSEIKLYNEAAVKMGRQQRDLLARLKPEIERARALYAQRVSSVDARGALFQQELVQTLADGDPSLLGNPA
jgi:hypothetical protein